jgi:hypothetical protein
MVKIPKTRELEPEEHALLAHLLSIERPGVEALRAQAEHVRAAVAPVDDPFWVDLYVLRGITPAATECTDDVSYAVTRDANDDPEATMVILFADIDGYLDRIEVMWFDTQPSRVPTPDELEPASQFRWSGPE